MYQPWLISNQPMVFACEVTCGLLNGIR